MRGEQIRGKGDNIDYPRRTSSREKSRSMEVRDRRRSWRDESERINHEMNSEAFHKQDVEWHRRRSVNDLYRGSTERSYRSKNGYSGSSETYKEPRGVEKKNRERRVKESSAGREMDNKEEASISPRRKRSAEPQHSSAMKRRSSVETQPPQELKEDNEAEEEVSGKKTPSTNVPVKVEVAPTSKMEAVEEVTVQAEVDEVTSQATLEISVEDDTVQDEDPHAEEKRGVLQELEIVTHEIDANHALLEQLKSQIGNLEVSLPIVCCQRCI